MSSKEITVLVDEQEVKVNVLPFSVFVHEGAMNIEVPNHAKVGPEETIEFTKGIPQEDWIALREAAGFRAMWDALWEGAAPPENLHKSSLAIRHTVGMIVLLVLHKANQVPVHLQYPETYLHPKQCARIVSMLQVLNPGLNNAK